MDAPVVLPVFVELLNRDDLQRCDALVYAALCVFDHDKISAKIADIAAATGISSTGNSSTISHSLSRLERAGFIERQRRRRVWKTIILGPIPGVTRVKKRST